MLRKRRYITLIEILIVMTILALLSSVIGINVMRSLKEQKFRMEVSRFVDTLRLAQDLMLIMGTDVHVRVAGVENQGVEYWLDVEGGIPAQWQQLVQGNRNLLKEVHGVFFLDQLPFPVIPGQLDIRFQSGGSMMSRGVLRLSDHDQENIPGALVMAVCLKGYPHPIISTLETDQTIECIVDPTGDASRLTYYTVQEIQEDDTLKASLTPPKGKNQSTDNDEDD